MDVRGLAATRHAESSQVTAATQPRPPEPVEGVLLLLSEADMSRSSWFSPQAPAMCLRRSLLAMGQWVTASLALKAIHVRQVQIRSNRSQFMYWRTDQIEGVLVHPARSNSTITITSLLLTPLPATLQAQMQRLRAGLPEQALEEDLLGWEDDLEAASTPAQLKGLLGSLEAAVKEDSLSSHYQRSPNLVPLAWPACGELAWPYHSGSQL